jgi:hypothetical protein
VTKIGVLLHTRHSHLPRSDTAQGCRTTPKLPNDSQRIFSHVRRRVSLERHPESAMTALCEEVGVARLLERTRGVSS